MKDRAEDWANVMRYLGELYEAYYRNDIEAYYLNDSDVARQPQDVALALERLMLAYNAYLR